MSQPTPTISIEDKAKIFEFHKIFKASPQSLTTDARKFLQEINEKLWEIKKDEKQSFEAQTSAFEMIRLTHEILGRNFQESWKPKEKGKGGGQNKSWTATKEQRTQNCRELKQFLQDEKIWETLAPIEKAKIMASTWGTIKS